MRKIQNRKLIIYALAISIIVTTVAYAALQTSLSISGSVNKKGGSWNVQFIDVGWVAGETLTTTPSVTGTSLTFGVTLKEPGDYVVIGFKIQNTGNIDAYSGVTPTLKVGSQSNAASATENWNYAVTSDGISCKMSLSSNIDASQSTESLFLNFYQVKANTTSSKIYLICRYDDVDSSGLSSTDVTVPVTFSAVYSQNNILY